MDAFNLLKADHRKVAELFEQLESASGKRKLDVFAQIKTELDLHAYIEEKVFYPALEEPSETHDLTLEAYEEHKQVKTLLSQLGRGRTANDEWQAKAKVLQENVEHHVEEEENELFKKARAVLSKDQIEELGMRLEEEKERKQGTKPSSGTKKAAAKSANKTAGTSKSASNAAKRVSRPKKSRSKKSGAKKR
ncbi:MAG TPA: hemerythrin domain-containing protein [Pyrinomonadaceae bacterium]|jgi:hemerythrin-like domain-containing protein|nr:hemerythrin domain-containing protein [Pyrinomonadaceae bacterium]